MAMRVDWEDALSKLLDEHAVKRQNGKVAGRNTTKHTREVAFNFMRRLHHLGYPVQKLDNVGEKHLRVVFRHWWFDKKLKPKSMEDYASRLRVLFSYIGKPRLVADHRTYLPEVDPAELEVRTAADHSKSWASNGIDFAAKVSEAFSIDVRFGLMLLAMLLFGLRRKEVVRLVAGRCDYGTELRIIAGMGKGNRERGIQIHTEAQRRYLELLVERVGKTVKLGWETTRDGRRLATDDQNEKRFTNLCTRIGITKALAGVTPHGLRHQFAENLSLFEGILPPTCGGTKGQMDRDDLNMARARISQSLGHIRISITNAYLGSLANAAALDHLAFQQRVSGALKILEADSAVIATPADRMEDALLIVQMVLTHDNVELRASEAHALWRRVCARHGVEWMAPEKNVRQYLEAASFDVINASLKAA